MPLTTEAMLTIVPASQTCVASGIPMPAPQVNHLASVAVHAHRGAELASLAEVGAKGLQHRLETGCAFARDTHRPAVDRQLNTDGDIRHRFLPVCMKPWPSLGSPTRNSRGT